MTWTFQIVAKGKKERKIEVFLALLQTSMYLMFKGLAIQLKKKTKHDHPFLNHPFVLKIQMI